MPGIKWNEIKRRKGLASKAILYYSRGGTIRKTARKLNVPASWVSRLLKRHGIKTRNYTERPMRHDFFAQIDTEEKAYWLGFLLADASINDKSMVSITLKSGDIGHLRKLRNTIKCKHSTIKVRERKVSFLNGRYNYRLWAAELVFTSHRICRDLRSLGITPRKSLTAKPPPRGKIQAALLRHFWRGVIDGDGTLGIEYSQDRRTGLSLCGTIWIVRAFARFVRAVIGGPRKSIQIRKNGLCLVSYRGTEVCRLICRLLWENSTVSLDRKRKLAKAIIRKVSRGRYSRLKYFGYRDTLPTAA